MTEIVIILLSINKILILFFIWLFKREFKKREQHSKRYSLDLYDNLDKRINARIEKKLDKLLKKGEV